MAEADTERRPHIPVLLRPLLAAVAPVEGTWLDGTFGAGGYARGLLEAGADRVIGVDRDPLALKMASGWAGDYGDRLRLVAGTFSQLDSHAGAPLDGWCSISASPPCSSIWPNAASRSRRTARSTCA